MEALTDDVEAEARKLMDQVEEMGGAVAAIERGFQKNEIEKAAYQIARDIDGGERIVVGVNRFASEKEEPFEGLRVDPAIEAQQAERLAKLRAERDQDEVDRQLAALVEAAARRRQRALPDEGGAAGQGHGGRGLQRAARGLGRLRPAGRVLAKKSLGGHLPHSRIYRSRGAAGYVPSTTSAPTALASPLE